MIESIAIRQYIISYFIKHPTKPLIEQVNHISSILGGRFVRGEIVFIKTRELTGKVVDSTASHYLIEVYDDNNEKPVREQVGGSDLMRKDRVTKNEVMSFILSVTEDTPFGRVLANNVIQDLASKKFAHAPPRRRSRASEWEYQAPLAEEGREPVGPEYMARARPGQKYPERQKRAAEEEAYGRPGGRGGAERARDEVVPAFNMQAPRGDLLRQKELEKKGELERKKMLETVEKQKAAILSVPKRDWKNRGMSASLKLQVLSTYTFLSTFSEFFKIDLFDLDDFVDALVAPVYHSRLACGIHSKILKAIAHERRKSGKDGLGDLIASAVSFVYENPGNRSMLKCIEKGDVYYEYFREDAPRLDGDAKASSAKFTRVQWFNGDATMRNWQQYVKSFVHDVAHVYHMKSAVMTNEFDYKAMRIRSDKGAAKSKAPEANGKNGVLEGSGAEASAPGAREVSLLTDRVFFLSFLVEICVSGTRFKAYFDSEVERLKEAERTRGDCMAQIKRIKAEISALAQDSHAGAAVGRKEESEEAPAEIADTVKSPGLTKAATGAEEAAPMQGLLEQLKKAESKIAEINEDYHPMILRSSIGSYGGIMFYFVNESVFYCGKDGDFFIIEKKDVPQLLEKIHAKTKSDAVFEHNLRRLLKVLS